MKTIKFFMCALALGLPCSVCFGQTWSTLPVDLVISMETSTPGTALTPAIVAAGTNSSTCIPGGSGPTGCAYSSVAPGMTVGANRSACSNLGPVQLNNGGTLYPAQSLNYNNIAIPDTDFGTISNFVFNDGIRPLNFTIMGCFTLGMPVQGGNNNDYDMIMIQDSEGLYADMQYNDNSGSPVVRIENHSVAHSSNISVEAGGTYFMSLNWNTSAATATLTIYTAQGALVGQSSVSDPSSGSGVTNVRLPSNENGTDSGTTYYQNIMMNWTTAPETLFWTSDSGTVQPPSGLSATVSVQ